jgi:type II secretory pathway pseudopilin PulG
MKNWKTPPRGTAGFTLLEVMVSLVLGMLIVGGVMGGISMSIRYSQQVQKRLHESAVIEAAAEHLLTRPQDFELGAIILDDFPGSPRVVVEAMPVDIGDRQPGRDQRSNLYRVLLSYANQRLEFSLLLPPEKEGKL